jgi:RNA polymerase sigma-70 factor, ECF subfamily
MPFSLVLALVRRRDLTRSEWVASPGGVSEHALVNGAAGVVTRRNGRMFAMLGFTITHGKIVAIDVLADPERLSRLDNVAG